MSVLKTLTDMMSADDLAAADAEYQRDQSTIEGSFVGLRIAIAREIERLMNENHWGAAEMGDHLGVSPKTFDKLKTGDADPSIDVIVVLSQLSGKTPVLTWR